MADENNININYDLTPIIVPLLQNQAYLRAIIETQTALIADLEGKDEEEVFEELHNLANDKLQFISEEHKKNWSELYKDSEGNDESQD